MSETLPRDAAAAAIRDPEFEDDVLVRVENLVKHFPIKAGGLISRTVGHVQAVDGISLTVGRGQTIGLGGDTEELRKKAVSEERHAAAAEVAE